MRSLWLRNGIDSEDPYEYLFFVWFHPLIDNEYVLNYENILETKMLKFIFSEMKYYLK